MLRWGQLETSERGRAEIPLPMTCQARGVLTDTVHGALRSAGRSTPSPKARRRGRSGRRHRPLRRRGRTPGAGPDRRAARASAPRRRGTLSAARSSRVRRPAVHASGGRGRPLSRIETTSVACRSAKVPPRPAAGEPDDGVGPVSAPSRRRPRSGRGRPCGDVTAMSAARATASSGQARHAATLTRAPVGAPLTAWPGDPSGPTPGGADRRSGAVAPPAMPSRRSDPVRHRRVGGEQPRDVLHPERVRDEQVTGVDDAAAGPVGPGTPDLELRSADASASGSPVSVEPSVVRVIPRVLEIAI